MTVSASSSSPNATVKRYLGFTVNPHLFRHIAAHMFLLRNPGGYEVMRRVFGHKRMETTSKFYAGLETLAAARHFDDEIPKLRDDTKRGEEAMSGGHEPSLF